MYAVFVLMAIDAVFPAASELVMLYAGAVAAGVFARRTSVSLFGAKFGCGFDGVHRRWRSRERSATSSARSSAGRSAYYGGRRCSSGTGAGSTSGPSELERAERWFDRWGNFGRLRRLDHARDPLVRLDPGRRLQDAVRAVHRADALGSAIWAFAIAGAGYGLGSSYERFNHDFRYPEYAIGAGILLLAAYLGLSVVQGRYSEAPCTDPAG